MEVLINGKSLNVDKYDVVTIRISPSRFKLSEFNLEEYNGKLHVSTYSGRLAAISGAGVNVLDLKVLELND